MLCLKDIQNDDEVVTVLANFVATLPISSLSDLAIDDVRIPFFYEFKV